MKKLFCLLLAAAAAAGGGTAATASSYDYRFRAEEYSGYYRPSEAEIRHDGHGTFSVDDTRGVISSDDGVTSVIKPSESATVSDAFPVYPNSWQGGGPSAGGLFTQGTSLAQPGGRIGTLYFQGQAISVYEGTSVSSLLKGAAHFSGTSAWDGNVCLAGHNRGPNAHFSRLKDVVPGDTVSYVTSLGTRNYRVFSVRTVSVDDLSPLSASDTNRITMVSCVASQPSLRLIVQAEQTGQEGVHA